MKKIILSVDNHLYAKSRLIAAQRGTTVTALVRDYLQGLSDLDKRREKARRALTSMIGSFGGKVGRMPSREERHARR